MYKHYSTLINTLGLAIGMAGIGYVIGANTKMAKVSERLDKSIDDLVNNMDIDISEELINKAVERVVEAEAKKAITKATDEALLTIKRDIHKTVSTEVEKEYTTIKDSVLEEITGAASKIDVDKVTRDVERTAEKKALEKFEINLDNQLRSFNNNLENAAKIYNAIRSSVIPIQNTSKEYIFRVG